MHKKPRGGDGNGRPLADDRARGNRDKSVDVASGRGNYIQGCYDLIAHKLAFVENDSLQLHRGRV